VSLPDTSVQVNLEANILNKYQDILLQSITAQRPSGLMVSGLDSLTILGVKSLTNAGGKPAMD